MGGDRRRARRCGDRDSLEGDGADAGARRGDRAEDPSRPGRVRRRRRRRPRARRALVPLRIDVVGRRRHGARAPDRRGRRAHPGRHRSRLRGGREARRGTPADADDRPHAWRSRRADDVRPQARRLGVRARARPGAARGRARGRAGREALRRGRELRGDRSRGRAHRVRAARARARAGGDAGRSARPACGLAVGAGADRGVTRAVRARDPAPGANGGRRGAGAVRQGPEGLVGDAAQAEPGRRRADLRSRTGRARGCRSSGSRTSRSGTSATSRTRRPSA